MKAYEIFIGSPPDYEYLVAEIFLDGRYLALISQEDGPDKLRVEFHDDHDIGTVDYDVLMDALRDAKEELVRK